MYSVHTFKHKTTHRQPHTNNHLSQFQSQPETPVCQSSNSVLSMSAFPCPKETVCVSSICVHMTVCVYVCVLAVWRPQIRWQLSYRAEPTYPKPSQTSGVTAYWLFPKHPFIFMSISHHFALCLCPPSPLSPSLLLLSPSFWSAVKPILVYFCFFVLRSSLSLSLSTPFDLSWYPSTWPCDQSLPSLASFDSVCVFPLCPWLFFYYFPSLSCSSHFYFIFSV